jgi:ketosteroid isomerase-like protein
MLIGEAHMNQDPVSIARAAYDAYVRKDRAAMEALIAPEYRFTSPLDNRLDRAAYFARCWPNSANMAACEIIYAVADGERAFVVYETEIPSGKRFRNCEVHIVRAGKLIATEVYFGWDIPHKAADGGFIDER